MAVGRHRRHLCNRRVHNIGRQYRRRQYRRRRRRLRRPSPPELNAAENDLLDAAYAAAVTTLAGALSPSAAARGGIVLAPGGILGIVRGTDVRVDVVQYYLPYLDLSRIGDEIVRMREADRPRRQRRLLGGGGNVGAARAAERPPLARRRNRKRQHSEGESFEIAERNARRRRGARGKPPVSLDDSAPAESPRLPKRGEAPPPWQQQNTAAGAPPTRASGDAEAEKKTHATAPRARGKKISSSDYIGVTYSV